MGQLKAICVGGLFFWAILTNAKSLHAEETPTTEAPALNVPQEEAASESAPKETVAGTAAQPADVAVTPAIPLTPKPAFVPSWTDDPENPPGVFWKPFFSLLLPGFGQWVDGQYGYASLYSGVAMGGYWLSAVNEHKLKKEYDTWAYESRSKEAKENRQTFGELERRQAYGSQLAFAAGSFSAYHAFRTAVPSQQKAGRFEFLTQQETPGELMMAPLRFDYLKRPSTWIPLGLIAGLAFVSSSAKVSESSEYERHPLNGSDYGYTAAISLAAGTHEELLFRGWYMPLMRQMTDGDLSANVITTATFALAHLGTTKIPIPQALLGFHLGWVTQRNDWALSESIFIHTWWDVFAFLMQYELQKKDPRAAVAPALWLPPIQLAF